MLIGILIWGIIFLVYFGSKYFNLSRNQTHVSNSLRNGPYEDSTRDLCTIIFGLQNTTNVPERFRFTQEEKEIVHIIVTYYQKNLSDLYAKGKLTENIHISMLSQRLYFLVSFYDYLDNFAGKTHLEDLKFYYRIKESKKGTVRELTPEGIVDHKLHILICSELHKPEIYKQIRRCTFFVDTSGGVMEYIDKQMKLPVPQSDDLY